MRSRGMRCMMAQHTRRDAKCQCLLDVLPTVAYWRKASFVRRCLMLVDIHTNLLWYPDHFSEEFVEFSWAAKKAKMRLTPDVHCGVDDAGWKHNFDSRPEQLLEATKSCDRV